MRGHEEPAMSSTYERDHQQLGNWQVFLRGTPPDSDVILHLTSTGTERRIEPQEALLLLNWLAQHSSELHQAAQWQETQQEGNQ